MAMLRNLSEVAKILGRGSELLQHRTPSQNLRNLSEVAKVLGRGSVLEQLGKPFAATTRLYHEKVIDHDENIIDSCFKTFGCGSAIASSSLATEWVKGRTLDEVVEIKNADIAKHLSLPPVKLHCSMLAEDAIKAAVKDLKKKNEEQ